MRFFTLLVIMIAGDGIGIKMVKIKNEGMFLLRSVFVFLNVCLLFQSACIAGNIEKNDVVTIKIITPIDSQEEIDSFKQWMYARLQVFADERKDFLITKDTMLATHSIAVYIDSILLINYQQYKNSMETVDSITSVTTQVYSKMQSNIFLRGYAKNALPLGIIFSESYENSAHPKMYVRVEIVDQNGRVVKKRKNEIESISTVAVNERQQLKDLFGILRTFVQDKNPYFKIK